MTWEQIEHAGFDVAVVGATGVVGQMLLKVFAERRFPIRRIRLLASSRSTERSLAFRGKLLRVQPLSESTLAGAQLVFFAATGSLSKRWAPIAAAQGAIVIDKSSTFRLDPDVPLVVPEVNGNTLHQHRGIIASPNCTTTGLVMAVEPLRRAAGLRSLVITTFQAASGAGREGSSELLRQQRAVLANEPTDAASFPVRLAGNVIAQCGQLDEDGYTDEEHKLVFETRKILDLPNLSVAVTAVRVPVDVGHSAAVLVETVDPLDVDGAKRSYTGFPGARYVEVPSGPTALDVTDSDAVFVGRLRNDFTSHRLWLWQVSNNLRKGAATNAIQIAEALADRRLVQQRGASARVSA